MTAQSVNSIIPQETPHIPASIESLVSEKHKQAFDNVVQTQRETFESYIVSENPSKQDIMDSWQEDAHAEELFGIEFGLLPEAVQKQLHAMVINYRTEKARNLALAEEFGIGENNPETAAGAEAIVMENLEWSMRAYKVMQAVMSTKPGEALLDDKALYRVREDLAQAHLACVYVAVAKAL